MSEAHSAQFWKNTLKAHKAFKDSTVGRVALHLPLNNFFSCYILDYKSNLVFANSPHVLWDLETLSPFISKLLVCT